MRTDVARKLSSKHLATFNVMINFPQYFSQIRAVLKSLLGPIIYISASTLGVSLPEVGTPDTMVNKDIGTSVKLSWDIPKDTRKVAWVYGIYYGVSEDELLAKSRLNTTNLTATVTKLLACEGYMFGVGIVGPYGVGPVSHAPAYVRTYGNRKAPPKGVTVEPDGNNDLEIIVRWSPSCASSRETMNYVVSKLQWNPGYFLTCCKNIAYFAADPIC